MELPKFRRIEDVQRLLLTINSDVDDLAQLVKSQQGLLAKLVAPAPKLRTLLSAAVSFEVTAPSKAGMLRTLKKAIDPSITKVVVPNIAKLKDQYGLLEDLHAKYVMLDSVSTQLEMQFPDKRGAAYDATVKSLTELKAKVELQMRKVFEFLNQVANKHVPEQFTEYVDAISTKITEHVYFEDSQRFLYVSVTPEEVKPQGTKIVSHQSLVFTEYILLTDSVSDEGKIAPQLYIIVQWVVGGHVSVFIEHEFTPPGKLTDGEVVDTVGAAVSSISGMLELEGFASYLGVIPMALQLSVPITDLKPSMFDARNYIDQIVADQDKLIFKFRHHAMTPETKKQVAYSLYPQLKALLKTKKAKVRLKITKTEITFFIVSPAQEGQAATHELDFLKEKFNLTDNAVARISRVINSR